MPRFTMVSVGEVEGLDPWFDTGARPASGSVLGKRLG